MAYTTEHLFAVRVFPTGYDFLNAGFECFVIYHGLTPIPSDFVGTQPTNRYKGILGGRILFVQKGIPKWPFQTDPGEYSNHFGRSGPAQIQLLPAQLLPPLTAIKRLGGYKVKGTNMTNRLIRLTTTWYIVSNICRIVLSKATVSTSPRKVIL